MVAVVPSCRPPLVPHTERAGDPPSALPPSEHRAHREPLRPRAGSGGSPGPAGPHQRPSHRAGALFGDNTQIHRHRRPGDARGALGPRSSRTGPLRDRGRKAAGLGPRACRKPNPHAEVAVRGSEAGCEEVDGKALPAQAPGGRGQPGQQQSLLLPFSRKGGERVSCSSLQALSLHGERVLTTFGIYSRGKAQKAGQQSPPTPNSSGPAGSRSQSTRQQVPAARSLSELHSRNKDATFSPLEKKKKNVGGD